MAPRLSPLAFAAGAVGRLAARVPDRVRSWIAGALGVAGVIFLARWLNGRVPVRSWFSLQLLSIWSWEVYLAAACASFGYRLAARLLPASGWTALEKVAVGYPAGVVVLVLGLYVAGFLHLLRPPLALLLPGLLLAVGAPPLVERWRAARAAGAVPLRLTFSAPALAVSALGLLLVGVVYLGAMSPDAINYDAAWNHLVIAQDYAREGRIIPFPGDWNKALPHLGSVLNTWSFLTPSFGQPALHWMTALHTEFVVFVWTLVAVAAAARWIADRQRPATWVAFALFPGIFVYDSNLGGSADHFLGLFAAPLLLLTGKALPRLDRGTCALWGALAGGALMTKAQGVYLVAPFALLLVLRAVQLAIQHRGGDRAGPGPTAVAKTAGLAAAAAFVVLLPHLGSNYVFYRNPVYPLLQDVFTASTPSIADAPLQVKYLLADWRYLAPEPLLDKLREGAKLAFTFSFTPHYSYVDQLPVFGSAFTLSLLFLPGLRDSRRLWLGALMAMGAVLTWAMTYRVDRNLQGITPALIAVTAAILLRAWEAGLYARLGVAALLFVQLAWAGNLYFQGADRLSGAAHLMRSTLGKRTGEALASYRSEYVALGKALPRDAVLMLHTSHAMLGIDRTVLLDWIGFQGLFDYRLYKTPADLHARLRAVGVTHVAWVPTFMPARSKQEELIFDAFADANAAATRRFGRLSMFPMPVSPPAPIAPYQVLVVGLGGYTDGLYPVEALSTCEELPPHERRYAAPARAAAPPATAWALIDDANAVFVGAGVRLDDDAAARLAKEFRQLRAYPAFRLLVRK